MATLGTHLGQAGPGVTVTIDGVDYIFTRTTQGMHAAFEDELGSRNEKRAMDLAAKYRKQAREKYAEANRLFEANIDNDKLSGEEKAELEAKIKDLNADARAMEYESQSVIDRVIEKRSNGHYEYFGMGGATSLRELPMQVYLCWLMLKPKQPGMTLQDVRDLWRDGTVSDWQRAIERVEGSAKKKDSQSPSDPSSQETQPTTTAA